jgi:hypothetical protein
MLALWSTLNKVAFSGIKIGSPRWTSAPFEPLQTTVSQLDSSWMFSGVNELISAGLSATQLVDKEQNLSQQIAALAAELEDQQVGSYFNIHMCSFQ